MASIIKQRVSFASLEEKFGTLDRCVGERPASGDPSLSEKLIKEVGVLCGSVEACAARVRLDSQYSSLITPPPP